MKAKQSCRGCGIAPLIHIPNGSWIPNNGEVEDAGRQLFSTRCRFRGQRRSVQTGRATKPLFFLILSGQYKESRALAAPHQETTRRQTETKNASRERNAAARVIE